MSKRSVTFDEVCSPLLRSPRRLSRRNIALFHYFNPNGLVHQKMHNDDRISRAVHDGLCKSGAILAYGGFSNFEADLIRELAGKCCSNLRFRPDRTKLWVAVDLLQDHIVIQHIFLSELGV